MYGLYLSPAQIGKWYKAHWVLKNQYTRQFDFQEVEDFEKE